jgi:serine/threonine protein kinase
MRFVHSRGFVHQELTPSNILLDDRGRTLISNFGEARDTTVDRGLPDYEPIAHYSAPEMFSVREANPKGDIFSFGLILYEILVGMPVFDPELSPLAVMSMLLNHELPSVPTIVLPWLRTLIVKCWDYNPANRPSFDDILKVFEENGFNISSGADTAIVRQYVRGVVDWEQMAEMHSPRPYGDSAIAGLVIDRDRFVLRLLGLGAVSSVFLSDSSDGTGRFALKRFSHGSLHQAEFEREIGALSKLRHRCVVRILGYQMLSGDKPAEIHLEYAEGGSLAHVLKQVESKSLPSFWNPTGISIIVCGIVLGMQHVHSRNFIHQDLKPSNILLTGEGHSLIADFGTAREITSEGVESDDMGTIHYSAPEILDSVPITQKADVFSFGSILYEILVGSPVFPPHFTPRDVFAAFLDRFVPSIPSKVLPSIQNLILKCWAFDPTSRPSFSDILDTFESISFEIIAGTDTETVRQYVHDILHADGSLPSSFEIPSFAPFLVNAPLAHRHRILGCGCCAIVSLAEPLDGTEPFAIKQFSSERFNESRFFREVETLIKLKHPCIPRLLRFALPSPYERAEIHMEYAHCGSLQSVLKDVALDSAPSFWNPTGISIIICGIVVGMRFVHSRNIIHHNLKPSNVLLKEEGYPLITDFGKARNAFYDCTRSGLNGTLQYTAPEMFSSSDTTTRVDVFSFGSILYEMLVGASVFGLRVPLFEIVRRLKDHEMPDIPDTVPSSIQTLISRCWEFGPGLRPSFDDIMKTFEGNDFDIVPGADQGKVREYVLSLCAQESTSQDPRT